MKIDNVLKLLERKPNTSKAELARVLGVKAQSLSNWFSRNNIPDEYSFPIADYFSKKFKEPISAEQLKGIKGIINNNIKYVPIIANVSCGASEISTLQDLSMNAFVDSQNWNASLYGVIANGDSMANEIYDGDRIIIDPTAQVQNGDMVYYKIGGESAVKIYVKDEDAYILQFVPLNIAEDFKIKTIRLDDKDAMDDLVIHKVVDVISSKRNNRNARLKMIGR